MDRVSRKKIKQDEFVDSTMHVFEWVEQHPKPLLYGAGGIVLAVLAVWGFMTFTARSASRASELLAQGQAALDAPVVANQPAKPADPYAPTFSSANERAQAAAKRLEDAAGRWGTPGHLARYLHGVALLRGGNAAGALTELQQAEDDLGGDPTIGPLVRAATAEALLQAGRTADAVEQWRKLATADSGYPRDLALEGLGRALEKAGNRDEAAKSYRELTDLYPNSPVLADAKRALARLGVEVAP
ncbi:MAG: tetratricopeptide repeat protein [Acidobacteria bacterium]|nr:tetratricopeptide repeat protein [Acidobacteriota bacterium]